MCEEQQLLLGLAFVLQHAQCVISKAVSCLSALKFLGTSQGLEKARLLLLNHPSAAADAAAPPPSVPLAHTPLFLLRRVYEAHEGHSVRAAVRMGPAAIDCWPHLTHCESPPPDCH